MDVVTVGMGPIGQAIAKLIQDAEDLELVGTVDPVVETALDGVPSMSDVEELHDRSPRVAIVATGSTLEACADTFESLLRQGCHVVSTCEELTFPFRGQAEIADRLDRAGRESGSAIVGCGVNPGFLMDVLPAMIASASLAPTSVRVRRLADLGRRRNGLSAKVGVGLTVDEWHARHEKSRFGHVGLVESALLCCAGLGWTPRTVAFERTPRESGGQVTGIREVATVDGEGESHVELELLFEHGGEDLDVITVDGEPDIRFESPGGVQGDLATAARALHSARCIEQLNAGLRLPLEVPAGRVGSAVGDYAFASQG